MFRTPTTGRRIGRLIGAAVIGAGLVISGAGVASANAPDMKARCAQFIGDADRLTQCVNDNGGTIPGCEGVEEGFSLQQCAKFHWNVGFDPLPGAPDNPGTPRAAAPPTAPKAAAKVAPKVTKKATTKKAPAKKPTTKKKTSKAGKR